MVDKWLKNGDSPLFCYALIERIQAAAHQVYERAETVLIPPVLLDIYELSVCQFEPTAEQFELFCSKYGIDAKPYLHFNKEGKSGEKPAALDPMRNFLHVCLLMLAKKLNVDSSNFKKSPGTGLYMVGGAVYNKAEDLAKAIYEKIAR